MLSRSSLTAYLAAAILTALSLGLPTPAQGESFEGQADGNDGSFLARRAHRLQKKIAQQTAASLKDLSWFTSQKDQFPFFAPAEEDLIVFDIGFNDGSDTAFYLKNGYHVVGIDANTELIEEGMTKFKDAITAGKLALINVGLEEESAGANLTFWRAKSNAQSSFEKDKACQEWWGGCEPVQIPVHQCLGLWSFGRPYLVKVDIEERHHVCVNALNYILPHERPELISWEMHEFAKGQPYPMMDAQLVLNLWRLGYTQVKMVDNGGGHEGTITGTMPADAIDWATGTTAWRSTKELFEGGLPDARKVLDHSKNYHWWDFYMRCDPGHPLEDHEDW